MAALYWIMQLVALVASMRLSAKWMLHPVISRKALMQAML